MKKAILMFVCLTACVNQPAKMEEPVSQQQQQQQKEENAPFAEMLIAFLLRI